MNMVPLLGVGVFLQNNILANVYVADTVRVVGGWWFDGDVLERYGNIMG